LGVITPFSVVPALGARNAHRDSHPTGILDPCVGVIVGVIDVFVRLVFVEVVEGGFLVEELPFIPHICFVPVPMHA
jgi:hypothetical protein